MAEQFLPEGQEMPPQTLMATSTDRGLFFWETICDNNGFIWEGKKTQTQPCTFLGKSLSIKLPLISVDANLAEL